jgi:hypothetical protein
MGNEGTRWKNSGLTRFENTIRMVGLLGHTQLGLVCHEIVVRYFFLVLPIDEFGVGRSHLFRTRSLRSRTPGNEPDPGQVDEPTPQVRNRVAQFDYRGYGHEHGKDLSGSGGSGLHRGRPKWNGTGLTWPNVKDQAVSCESKTPISTIPIQYAVGITMTEQNRRNG